MADARKLPANMDLSPSVLKAVELIAPCLPYCLENGDLYVAPKKPEAPFVPDQEFDGPA